MTTSDMVAGRRSIVVRQLLIVYSTQLLTMLLSLIPITFLPHYLNASGMGRLTIAISITEIAATVIVLGTGNFLMREIAREHGRLPELLSNTLGLRVALSVCLLPIVFFTTQFLGYPEQTRLVILIMYISMGVRISGEPFGLALYAIGKTGWTSAVSVILKVLNVGLGWVVLVGGGGIIGWCIAMLVGNSVAVLLNMAYFLFVAPFRFTVHRRGFRLALFGGLPFFAWVLLQTIYQQTSSLSLGRFGGEVAAGWYGAAIQLVSPLYVLPSVAITVLLPQFSQLSAKSEADFRHAISRTLNYLFLIAVPAACGLLILAGRVIDLFNYPTTFQNSIPVLQLLALTLPVTSVTMVIATGVSAMKRERSWAVVSLCSLIVVVILNVSLIPLSRDLLNNAAVGAAAAVLGAECITIVVAWFLFGQAMVERTVYTVFAKVVLANALMVVVVLGVVRLPLAIPIVLGALSYGGMVLLLKAVPADDYQAARAAMGRRVRPAVLALRTVAARVRS